MHPWQADGFFTCFMFGFNTVNSEADPASVSSTCYIVYFVLLQHLNFPSWNPQKIILSHLTHAQLLQGRLWPLGCFSD